MARAGEVVAGTIALLGELAQPGLTTGELDRLAEDFIREHGGVPTYKGYRGFPAATCISPNSMVVHGIPNDVALKDGDIVSLDFGVIKEGWHADGAWTYAVGKISTEAQRLMNVTRAVLRSPGAVSAASTSEPVWTVAETDSDADVLDGVGVAW